MQLLIFFYFRKKRPYKIVIRNISTKSFIDTIAVNSSANNETGSFSIYINILEEFPIMFAGFELRLQTQRNVYGLSLLNRTIDFCKYFENHDSEPYINIVYETISSFGNLPQNCPVKAVSVKSNLF